MRGRLNNSKIIVDRSVVDRSEGNPTETSTDTILISRGDFQPITSLTTATQDRSVQKEIDGVVLIDESVAPVRVNDNIDVFIDEGPTYSGSVVEVDLISNSLQVRFD